MEVPQVRQEFGSPAGLVNQEFGSPVDLVNQEFGSPAVLVNQGLVNLRKVSGRGGAQRRGEASPRIYASIGIAYYQARPATPERSAAD